MNSLEALIASMKSVIEPIVNGYQYVWGVEDVPGLGVARAGTLNGDGELCAFVDVSISDYSGNELDDLKLAKFIAAANPVNVQTLIAALEQSQAEREEFRKRLKLERSILEDADKRIAELEKSLRGTEESLVAAVDQIAELETSKQPVKLHKRSVGEVMHMSGFSRDYAEGWCAGNDNAIHEIHAAGGSVEGSE